MICMIMYACLLNSKRDPFLRDFAGSQETLVFSVCARWLETRSFLPPTATGGLGGGGGGGAVLREALEPPDVVSGERLPETL